MTVHYIILSMNLQLIGNEHQLGYNSFTLGVCVPESYYREGLALGTLCLVFHGLCRRQPMEGGQPHHMEGLLECPVQELLFIEHISTSKLIL